MAQRYYGRQRAYSTFAADVEDWVKETEARMLTVAQTAIQDLTINANTPVREGGRMRIDTGFLWHSGLASLNGMPSGPSEKPANAQPNSFAWDGEAVTAVILNLKLGDTFYFGWTANYAQYRELYDGFMEASLQNWPRYVAFATDTAKKASE